MSNKELNTTSITKLYTQVLLKDFKIKLSLDKSISDKIKYLCREISTEEWSGVLFYQVEGTVADARNMTIHLKEIYPMHKGTPGHTDYEYNAELVGFRMDHMEINRFNIGHIHSHNTMGVFFSGEDTSELNDNIEKHNYYLSVIVNNNFEVTARLAFKGTRGGLTITGKNENGEHYQMLSQNVEEVIFYYECEIKKDDPIFTVDVDFAQRTAQIIFQAEERKKIVVLFNYQNEQKPITGFVKPFEKNSEQNWFPKNHEYTQKQWDKQNGQCTLYNAFDEQTQQEELEEEQEEEQMILESLVEETLISLLTAWPDLVLTQEDHANLATLEDAFLFLRQKVRTKNRNPFFSYVCENLQAAYNETFPVTDDLNEINFQEFLELSIQLVEEFCVGFINASKFNSLLINQLQI